VVLRRLVKRLAYPGPGRKGRTPKGRLKAASARTKLAFRDRWDKLTTLPDHG
jgi:hypothetical protein